MVSGTDGPITVCGVQGFTAEIDRDGWLLVGAPASVTRTLSRKTVGPWSGSVTHFRRAWATVSEWELASGETRRANGVGPLDEGQPIGHRFPISMRQHEWTATIVEADEAIEVAVTFIIQNGATRRRSFYVLGHIDFFARPSADSDQVEVIQLPQAEIPTT